MQWLLAHPPVLAGLAVGIVLLLIIAIAPEYLANIVSQIFQLFGRLVATLAGEAEAGANALFDIVRGVFNRKVANTQNEQRAQSQAAALSSTPASASKAADQESADEIPYMWVAETIFVRLLYLATVIVVVGSDFVFAILRLQAVLFPSLPAPLRDLSFLSLLTGALFVAIVLLTGALTLDFLNILPPPARLFPNLDDGKRRLLLWISVLSFVLSILVVGALFLQGQLLISLAETFPIGAIALATLIGVLQVLVVFLGAWGAIRGLAIILALLGGVVGLVLHLVGLALRWVADGLDVIGTSILPDLIYGIAAIFGHRRERPTRPSPVGNVLSIVGYGDRSSQFVAVLCDDIVRMYARGGLLATGVYAEEPSVREDVRSKLGRLGVNNISPLANSDPDPLHTLKSHVIRAYHGKSETNKMVLWVVDGEKAAQTTSTLAALKSEMPDLSVTVLCLLPPGGIRGADPFAQLKKLATEKRTDKGTTAIGATILVDARSPLYRIMGEPIADQLVARSLSGMLLAPLHSPANPSFVTIIRNLNEAGYAFAALSTDSVGIVSGSASTESTPASRRSSGSGSVSPEQAVARTEEITRRLLTGASATTIEKTPASSEAALYLSFVVPISARSPEFAKYRGLMSNWLADEYAIYLYSVADGEGIDVSESMPTSKGDRYSQVGVLYGVTDADLPQRALASPAHVVDA
ncbi:MAG TPA: hypothetical protein VF818_09550 [Ktedonobacterales bacterium]